MAIVTLVWRFTLPQKLANQEQSLRPSHTNEFRLRLEGAYSMSDEAENLIDELKQQPIIVIAMNDEESPDLRFFSPQEIEHWVKDKHSKTTHILQRLKNPYG